MSARWIICPSCGGDGESSAHLGAIPMEEMHATWSQDEIDALFAGEYDRQCEVCGGAGKVRPAALERDPADVSEDRLRAMGG